MQMHDIEIPHFQEVGYIPSIVPNEYRHVFRYIQDSIQCKLVYGLKAFTKNDITYPFGNTIIIIKKTYNVFQTIPTTHTTKSFRFTW